MSDQAVTSRFTIEYRTASSSVVVSSASYNEPDEALQAYKDAAEAFRAAKLPPGASLSLNDQKLEMHAGAVSEGLGVVRHSWSKDPARERFDALQVSAQDRPEQAALRAAFAGVAREADRTGATPAAGGTIEFTERIASKEAGRPGADPDRVGGPEDEARVDSLRKRYLRTPDGYHDKQTMELVIADKGNKLVTQREDLATVDAMAVAASDRGWSAVTLSGTEAFRREAWYQLSARGVEVTGYSPTQADKARLAEVHRAQDQESKPYTDSVLRDVQRRDQERKDAAASAKPAAEAAQRSPVEEASNAVRKMASDISIEGATTPREQLAVSAAANQAYGAAVAANEKERGQVRGTDKGRAAELTPARSTPARAAERPLTTDQQVMVAAVDRALRDGGLSAEQRERVREVASKVAAQHPETKAPKVADRSAIPQPVASPAPQKQAKRDLSR